MLRVFFLKFIEPGSFKLPKNVVDYKRSHYSLVGTTLDPQFVWLYNSFKKRCKNTFVRLKSKDFKKQPDWDWLNS
jgi:purine nucleoside phosphorylase